VKHHQVDRLATEPPNQRRHVVANGNSLAILADRGIVKQGTVIELVPAVRPHHRGRSEDLFRAEVVSPQGGENSIRWYHNGRLLSAASLLARLEQNHGAHGIAIVYRNWRIEGHELSIWDEANALLPGWRRGLAWLAMHAATVFVWLGQHVTQVVIPVLIAIVTAIVLAWIGLSK
jgi:hypothetical protein